MNTTTVETLIIGAGLTGLTTAFKLKDNDKSFLVLEKNKTVGGVIKTHVNGDFIYESGPNSGMVGNIEVVKLFDKLEGKIEIEKANDTVKKRYVLKNGKWQALPSGLTSAVSTPLFSLKDKFRILGEPFRKKGNDENETLAELVKRRMGDSFLNYAIDPFILGVYAGDPNKLVPKYALPKLYDLEQDFGSFIGGAFKKSRLPKSDLEKRVTKDIFMIKGGLSKFVEVLYENSGKENFLLESNITSINKTDYGFETVYSIGGIEQKVISKKLITTFGGDELKNLFVNINTSNFTAINNVEYAAVVQVAVGFKNWKGIELDAFGGLIPFVEKRKILGAVFISALNSSRAPKGGALLSVFIGGVRNKEAINMNDDEVFNTVKSEFYDLMGVEDFNPDIFEIFRYHKAIPQYYANTKERLEAFEKLELENPGLIIGGNTNDGIGMSDRIQQGAKLADRAI